MSDTRRLWRIDQPTPVVTLPAWTWGSLLPRSYSVVNIDPPWPYDTWSDTNQTRGASAQYDIMTREDIIALNVRRLCQDDTFVSLWATAPMLPFALNCLEEWRIKYVSTVIWRKITASGKPRMGMGFWARTMHEQVLIGTIGKPKKHSAMPSIFNGVAREHSRKPDEFYAMIEKHVRGTRRADLFSRETRAGWDAFGNEAGKFDGVANAAA